MRRHHQNDRHRHQVRRIKRDRQAGPGNPPGQKPRQTDLRGRRPHRPPGRPEISSAEIRRNPRPGGPGGDRKGGRRPGPRRGNHHPRHGNHRPAGGPPIKTAPQPHDPDQLPGGGQRDEQHEL